MEKFIEGAYYKYKHCIEGELKINKVYKAISVLEFDTCLVDENNKKYLIDNSQRNKFVRSGITDETWERKCELAKFYKEDKVNHPTHYNWLKDKCGIEVIDITRHMDFSLGNVVKYVLRAGHKTEEGYSDKEKELEDLNKALWYLKDKIKVLEEIKR